jgi:hypothetical protein
MIETLAWHAHFLWSSLELVPTTPKAQPKFVSSSSSSSSSSG